MTYNQDRRFEWDPDKARSNLEKHGLSFEEASELFTPEAVRLEGYDEYHSDWEDRITSIGPIARGVIVVVWTEPDEDITRIISARLADARERERYRRYLEAYLWTTFQS